MHPLSAPILFSFEHRSAHGPILLADARRGPQPGMVEVQSLEETWPAQFSPRVARSRFGALAPAAADAA